MDFPYEYWNFASISKQRSNNYKRICLFQSSSTRSSGVNFYLVHQGSFVCCSKMIFGIFATTLVFSKFFVNVLGKFSIIALIVIVRNFGKNYCVEISYHWIFFFLVKSNLLLLFTVNPQECPQITNRWMIRVIMYAID